MLGQGRKGRTGLVSNVVLTVFQISTADLELTIQPRVTMNF